MRDDAPFLDYESEDDGPIYHHESTGKTVVGNELGATDDPDKWHMRWYCPCCGVRDPPEDELVPAGMTSIHVPCATDDELEFAEIQEEHVAVNVQNAKAFDDGAYGTARDR